jgi:proline utilization trans-activator
MVFILGSRSLHQEPGSLAFQRTYSTAVNERLPLLNTSHLPNVCAFLLLALYSHNTNDRTGAWVYLGVASRLAISMGMHRESAGHNFESIPRELRKRIWWTLYGFEQHLCCSLGRPSAIDERQVNVGVADEDILQCFPGQSSQFAQASVRLLLIVGDIRRSLQNQESSAVGRISKAVQLLRSLVDWKTSLPPEIIYRPFSYGVENPIKWRRLTMLHIRYEFAIHYLTRSFLHDEVEYVERGTNLGDDTSLIADFSKIAVTAAMRCLRMLTELGHASCFNGSSWIDAYYAYLVCTDVTFRILTLDENLKDARKGNPKSSAIQELESLIAHSLLVEDYSVADLTDAIRQISDVMKKCEMCGFSTKCNMVITEFAKAVGVIDGQPVSTIFSGQTGQGVRLGEMDHFNSQNGQQTPGAAIGVLGGDAPPIGGQGQDIVGSELLLPHQAPRQAGQSINYPVGFPVHELDFEFSGVHNTASTAGLLPPQLMNIQWDQVLEPGQWEQPYNMLIDMSSNAWTWPNTSDFPYNHNPYSGQ